MNFLITTSTLISIFSNITYNLNQSNFNLLNDIKIENDLNYKHSNIDIYQYNQYNQFNHYNDNYNVNDNTNDIIDNSLLLYCEILNNSIILQTFSIYQYNMDYDNNRLSCMDIENMIDTSRFNSRDSSNRDNNKDSNRYNNIYESLFNYSIDNEYVFKRIVIINSTR
jgi:hypothetical protein